MIPERIKNLLENMEFLCVATVSSDSSPCVANKFLIRCEEGSLYFGDFAKGRTWHNLKRNPKISTVVMDERRLVDFQINGTAQLVDSGASMAELLEEFSRKEVRFATKRLIEGLRKERGSITYQLPLLKKVVIWKIEVNEVIALGPEKELREGEDNE